MNDWISKWRNEWVFFLKRPNKQLFSDILCLSVEERPNIILPLDAKAKPRITLTEAALIHLLRKDWWWLWFFNLA